MDDYIRKMNMAEAARKVSNVSKVQKAQQDAAKAKTNAIPQKSFTEVLHQVKFSKHATERLNTRDIKLSEPDLERLGRGVGLAREKGIKQTLIMMDNRVFIASVTNNTIITASTDDKLKENVFTNIDGAVIV